MYALVKEHPNKQLLKVRRAALPQKVNNFDVSIKKDTFELNEICPKIDQLVNNKSYQQKHHQTEVEISAQHEAMIRYLNDSWRRIQQELEYSQVKINGLNINNDSSLTSTVTNVSNGNAVVVQSKIKYINECTTSKIPKNFVPFDLDSFFGQRFIQKLLQS